LGQNLRHDVRLFDLLKLFHKTKKIFHSCCWQHTDERVAKSVTVAETVSVVNTDLSSTYIFTCLYRFCVVHAASNIGWLLLDVCSILVFFYLFIGFIMEIETVNYHGK